MSDELEVTESTKVKISMNMDDMTFGDMEIFENVTGLVMSDAIRTDIVRDPSGRAVPDPDDPKGRPLKETKMSVKAMMGMVYISMLRDNPELTFADVRKIKMADIDFDLVEDVEEGKENS